MLSLNQLRRIDPTLSHLSDEEFSEICNSLYELGQLIFDDWYINRDVSKYPVGLLAKDKKKHKIK